MDTASLNGYYIFFKPYAGPPDSYDTLYYDFRYDAPQMSPNDPPFHGLPARVVVANYAYFTKPAPPGVTALRACAIII